jgi:glycosyltransferase involved in cell wall biosynthesis
MALLMPIDWPEPFGLVMIEAMACGTPVIAYGSGSVPEVVEHGLTGFIVDSEAAAAAIIDNQLSHLSRDRIRARFEERFTARRMASDYVEVYRGLIAGGKRPLRTVNGSAKSSARPQDGRHQSGMDGELYMGD